jgi:hypothetical protein
MASPNIEIETLITVTGRLIRVLDREIELLRAMEVGQIQTLQDEKLTLILTYEECVKALAGNPAALDAMAPPLRAELSALARRFDSTVAENARALHAVRDSHDRLLKAIVDAVSENRTRHKGYSANGTVPPARRGSAASTLSLSLDQRL